MRPFSLWCLLLAGSSLGSAATLALPSLVSQGLLEHATCYRVMGSCTGETPLAPNALAAALGLPVPNTTQNGYDTAGRGWRVQSEEGQGTWRVTMTPLGRALTSAELSHYPEPPVPAPARPPVTRVPIPKPPTRCVVVVDVRGLGTFQRDMTSILYDAQGHQLWPNKALIQEGDLHTYVTSEGALKAFGKVTRVRALQVQPNRLTPSSGLNSDAVLGPASSATFLKAGKACRLVYLMNAR